MSAELTRRADPPRHNIPVCMLMHAMLEGIPTGFWKGSGAVARARATSVEIELDASGLGISSQSWELAFRHRPSPPGSV